MTPQPRGINHNTMKIKIDIKTAQEGEERKSTPSRYSHAPCNHSITQSINQSITHSINPSIQSINTPIYTQERKEKGRKYKESNIKKRMSIEKTEGGEYKDVKKKKKKKKITSESPHTLY